MMRKIAAIILLSLCTYSVCAQPTKAELEARITQSKSYGEKIAAYLNFIDKYGLADFDKLLQLSSQGLQLARANGDSVAAGQLLRSRGEAWYFKGRYDVAAVFIYQSINVLEKTAAKAKLALSYNALAKLYRKTRELDRAAQHYDAAMDIYRNLNDSTGMAIIYNESGVVFEYRGEYDKAIDRYKASLELDKKLNDSLGISYALGNIAGGYLLLKKFSESQQALLQALYIRKKLKDTFALAINYADLGSTYNASGDYKKAALYTDSSMAIGFAKGYRELLLGNFELLSDIAQKSGNSSLALDYYKRRSALKDSIFGIEKTKQIEELNTRYETVKKEQLITEQRDRLARQKLLLGSIGVAVALIGLLTYTQYRRYKWKQEARLQTEILKQQELATRAVLEAEEAERQRIAQDLHDGVGQMMSAAKMNLSAYEHSNHFVSETEKYNFDKIVQLVDDSCREVRAVSHNMMPNALLKNSLASAIREFIDKLDNKALKVHLYTEGLDERLGMNVETVLYRVIQECVNNVIKHAGANVLDITVLKDEETISATIEDNGKGFDTSDSSRFEGIGLKNIRTRVEYLKGTVELESTPGKGTLVVLHIPLHNN